jgi:hypothetical protein
MQISTNAIASRYSNMHLTSLQGQAHFQEEHTGIRDKHNANFIIAHAFGKSNRFSTNITVTRRGESLHPCALCI